MSDVHRLMSGQNFESEADLRAFLQRALGTGNPPRQAAATQLDRTMALVAFRREPDGPAARKALAAARRSNKHVPAYLAGTRKLPRRLPDYIGFGDESEAIAYAAEHRQGWQTTPGALAWLTREATGAIRQRKHRQ